MEDRWLLLRGLGRERAHWMDFPRRLQRASEVAEVVCLDLPGAGSQWRRSAPPRVRDIARDVLSRLSAHPRFGSSRFWIFGISLGGMVTLELSSLIAPSSVAGLAIANSSSRLCRLDQRMRPAAFAKLARALAEVDPERRERLILEVTSNRSAQYDREILSRVVSVYGQRPVSRRAIASQLWAASRFRLPRKLPAPLLVLSSQADRLVDPACSKRIARRFAAEHRQHGSAGHDLPLDEPDWVCQQLVAFQRRTAN